MTDKYGAVQSSYDYDAFGSPYLDNLENDIGFGYCGKVYDNGTGLYDYGFRDYSPNNARFTTVDPIRDGSNWFSYVVNDPVNYYDPLGLNPFSDLIDDVKELYEEAKKLPGKAKEAFKKKVSEAKTFIKKNINTESNYLQNDSDLWVAGTIESVDSNFELTPESIEEKALELIAAPHGGRTEIQVDSVTYPDINNIDDVLSWYYAGVTDGNAIIVYGNKESGYKVKTKNVTKKASSFSEFIANAVSKVYSKKGPYKGLDNAKDIKGHWTIDNNNPNGAAPLINIRAQEIARDRNIQEIQKLNGISVSPIDSSNSNLSNGNGIIFNNINFNSSGNAYIGFNGFSGGCTK